MEKAAVYSAAFFVGFIPECRLRPIKRNLVVAEGTSSRPISRVSAFRAE
jgi:hypothetical protein